MTIDWSVNEAALNGTPLGLGANPVLAPRRVIVHNDSMVPAALQGAFGTVLFVVVVIAAIAAVVSLISRSRLYDQIGRGGLSLNEDAARGGGAAARAGAYPALAPGAPLTPGALERERDDEIRQMLQARNERRERRGEAPVDIEAELARLTAPAPVADPQLAEEVRQLVIARNERRERQGKEPLDVESEVARQLRELGA